MPRRQGLSQVPEGKSQADPGQILLTCLPLVLGLMAGAILVKVQPSVKLTAVYLAAALIAAGLGLMLVCRKSLYKLFLFAAFFALPIPLSFSFTLVEDAPFLLTTEGVYVHLVDLCVLAAAFCWYLLERPPTASGGRFHWHWALLAPGLLLLAINIISAATAPYPDYAFNVVFNHVKMLVLFLLVANLVMHTASVKVAVYGLLAVLALEGLIGIEQKLLGVIFTDELLGRSMSLTMQIGQQMIYRVAGTLDHPNSFSLFLNLGISIAVFLAWQEQRLRVKILLIGIILLAVMAQIFSGSRSGWIGLVLALAACTPLWLHRRGQNPFVGMLFVGLIGAILGLLLFAASSSFRDRLLLDDHGTAEVRYPLMQVAGNMISENPLLGVGLNHYTHFMTNYDRTADAIAFDYPYPVHNAFLLMAAETGIPSLLLFLGLLATSMWMALRTLYRSEGVVMATSAGILAGLIGLVIHNMGNPSSLFEDQPLWLLMALNAGMYCSTRQPVTRTSGGDRWHRGTPGAPSAASTGTC